MRYEASVQLPEQELWLITWWTLSGAALLFVHAVLLWKTLRSKLSKGLRALSVVVPIATPVVAWMAGSRVFPVVWVFAVAVYAWLRSIGG